MDPISLAKLAMAAAREAKTILATHETSKTRIIALEESYDSLGKLSLSQDDLFRQSLRAAEESLYRSSIVMAWAGFMDFLEEKLAHNGFAAVNREYTTWKIKSTEDLRDIGSDFQLIDAARRVGLCGKTGEKALKGLLNRRNESAHPSNFYPGLNEALGYISEVLQRIRQLQPRDAK